MSLSAMIAAGLGMAAPLIIGATLGNLDAGVAAALGSMLVGNSAARLGLRVHARLLGGVFAAAAPAVVAAVVVAGHGGWTDAAVVVLAGAAAVLGGYSRPFAQGTSRFIVFLPLTLSVVGHAQHRGGLPLAMIAGALWTAALTFSLEACLRGARQNADLTLEPIRSQITTVQRIRRLRRSLSTFAGHQFALRLVACLTIAGWLHWSWPQHHFQWIALTVAILCRRPLERYPTMATQRTLGAVLGVAASAMLLAYPFPLWAFIAILALLAAIRPWLRTRNYLAYSASMIPLIMLLMDGVRPVAPDVLADRLVATVPGAALVIGGNALATMVRPKPD